MMECDVEHTDRESLFDETRAELQRVFCDSMTPVHTETNVTLIRKKEGPLSCNCISASLTIMQLIRGPLEDMQSRRDTFYIPSLFVFPPYEAEV